MILHRGSIILEVDQSCRIIELSAIYRYIYNVLFQLLRPGVVTAPRSTLVCMMYLQLLLLRSLLINLRIHLHYTGCIASGVAYTHIYAYIGIYTINAGDYDIS